MSENQKVKRAEPIETCSYKSQLEFRAEIYRHEASWSCVYDSFLSNVVWHKCLSLPL